MFNFASSKVDSRKRPRNDVKSINNIKRLRTPSPISRLYEDKLEVLLLARSRMKCAQIYLNDFKPHAIFQRFPELDENYKLVVSFSPFEGISDDDMSNVQVQSIVDMMKDMLIHSFVRSQENNWLFVTQIEAYYHDKAIDDVAQIDKSSKYPNYLEASIEKFEMGKGSWYELRFRCQKVEFIATGGIFQSEQGDTKLVAFLGVAVPSFICHDTELLIFSPTTKPESVACVRMLPMNFCTPNQLRLFEEEPNGFTAVCSRIISLVIGGALTIEKMEELESRMTDFKYYKSIGLNEVPSKDAVLNQIRKIRKKEIAIKLSKPKILLIDIIFSLKMNISNQNLLLLYNGIIYPKVKSINQKRIKELHL
ncbi:hypothetical protein INT47_005192 [Mucor saturninus]|uniref:Uncharacterized protein n=1 Tax=Mucor saturninus TaxID=64648 RepID=A0A8H7QVR5_9FUNG|nr:hypothetical protein INT47_005192 [Mucor saturninus]